MKIESLVKSWLLEACFEGDDSDVVRIDMKLSQILSPDDLRFTVKELGKELGVDVPAPHVTRLETVGDLIHIFCVLCASDEYDESEPPIMWRGTEMELRSPILCEGKNLMVMEVIKDPNYGRIFVTYHGRVKRYAYADSCVFIIDQAIVEELDNRYGCPVRRRGIVD